MTSNRFDAWRDADSESTQDLQDLTNPLEAAELSDNQLEQVNGGALVFAARSKGFISIGQHCTKIYCCCPWPGGKADFVNPVGDGDGDVSPVGPVSGGPLAL